MRLLVTGGAGFIGSNFIRFQLGRYPDTSVVNLDALNYAGNLENLKDVENDPRYRFVHGDVTDRPLLDRLLSEGVDAVVNFAAESHVDRSIEWPEGFFRTNILGTQALLDAAGKHKVGRFLQISTDEVYGALTLSDPAKFTEDSPLRPRSPYAATKASADLTVLAYRHTYGIPALICRSTNNFGPYQFPEKLLPLFITNAQEDRELPIYGDGLYVRDWIYVEDNCEAIDAVLRKGRVGEVYNVSAHNERQNLEVIDLLLKIMGKPPSLKKFVRDRPGHDRRYACDSSKLRRELGWKPSGAFELQLEKTVEWYLNHRDWWSRIKSGEYRTYYDRMYAGR